MTTLLQPHNDAYEKGLADARRRFCERLAGLPPEVASELVDLLQQHSSTSDAGVRAEIAAVFQEIMMPETLLVELRREFDLTHEAFSDREQLQEFRRKVGLQIKMRRVEIGLSQQGLAEKAGIPQSHVCRLETGVHVPTGVTMERVAKALGTTPSQLDPGCSDV